MIIPANLRRVAEYLDREVHESERGSIGTLNDLPLTMIEEVRALRKRAGRLPACEYLAFFVAQRAEGDVQDFCEEVLDGKADPATWHISDCIFGVMEMRHEAVALNVGEYVEALKALSGERWFRADWIHPSERDFTPPDAGPGILVRATRYWTRFDLPRTNVAIQRLILSYEHVALTRIADVDIDVAVRRWMATTAAWWARKYLMAEGPHATVEGVIAAYPEPVSPSADGFVAIRALVREAQAGDPRWPSRVGFIGPDKWYRP